MIDYLNKLFQSYFLKVQVHSELVAKHAWQQLLLGGNADECEEISTDLTTFKKAYVMLGYVMLNQVRLGYVWIGVVWLG